MYYAPVEHSTVRLTCIELPHGFKTFALSIFEWLLKTGFTVESSCRQQRLIIQIDSQAGPSLCRDTRYFVDFAVNKLSFF